MKAIKWILIIFTALFTLNLLLAIFNPWFYVWAGLLDTKTINSNVDLWAFRGQIGDILAGHFTALSLMALFYSIMLQRESVNQMGTSILKMNDSMDLQKEAIQQQTKALDNQQKEIELQNKALVAQVKEMKEQKEEFEKSNLLSTYNRHFNRLHELEKEFQFELMYSPTPIQKKGLYTLIRLRSSELLLLGDNTVGDISTILQHCSFIYDKIQRLKNFPTLQKELTDDLTLSLRQIDFFQISSILIYILITDGIKRKIDDNNLTSFFVLASKNKATVEELLENIILIKAKIKSQAPDVLTIIQGTGIIRTMYPGIYDVFMHEI